MSLHQTIPQQKLHGLDHLRAFAILFVFLYHYFNLSHGQPQWLPDVAKFGWTGVDLFFVLSGFLIASQLFVQIKQGQTISFKQFFLKRFFRIIPAYLVTVAIYFCIPFFREKESLPPLWKFLTFTQNLGLDLKTNGTFSHCWSLCVEEHFYLFFPLILIFLQVLQLTKRSYLIILLLFFAGFAARYFSYDHLFLPESESGFNGVNWYKFIYYPTYNRLDGLLVGVGIAGIYQFRPVTWGHILRFGNVSIIAGVAVLTGAYFLCEDQMTFSASVFGFPLIAVGYGLIVMGAISPTSFLYKWKSKVTSFVAAVSYAVYLTHKGIIHVTHELIKDHSIDSNLLLLISMAACITAAYILHIVVEKPFMKLRNRIVH